MILAVITIVVVIWLGLPLLGSASGNPTLPATPVNSSPANLSASPGSNVPNNAGGSSSSVVVSSNGQCYVGLMQPSPSIAPISAYGNTTGDIPLLPVPSDSFTDTSSFTTLNRVNRLGMIGKVHNQFGDWFFIQVKHDNNIVEVGFVKRVYIEFSGSFDALPVIEVRNCA